jgi:serine/threonine protein kinase
MGTVYAAHDTVLDRRVAVKVISPEHLDSTVSRKRFLQEARAAASVNHPRLVTVHEVDEHEARVFLVLEYLAGGSVNDLLRARGRLDWQTATRVAIEVCQALEACHARGIVHRDVKPANFLVSDDTAGFVKLSDFGLAKLRDSQTTMTGSREVLGTPAFMSPEQCRAEPVDARSDIYALGAAYFAMLAGKPPFDGDVDVQVMFGHCSKPIPNPSELVPGIPVGCTRVIERAMAKQPFDRYRTATEMRQALEGLLADPAAVKPLASRLQKTPSPMSRDPKWIGRGVMAFVCLVGVGAWTWWPRDSTPGAASAPMLLSRSDSDGVWTLTEKALPVEGRDHLVADGEVHALAMAPDGRWLAWGVGGKGPVLAAVDWPTCSRVVIGARRATFDAVQAITFTPNGLLIAAAGEGVFAFDLDTQRAWKLMRIANGRARSLACHDNAGQAWLVVGVDQWDGHGGVDRYELATEPRLRCIGTPERLVQTDLPIKSVTFSPNGRWVAASDEAARLRVWGVDDWKAVAARSLVVERAEASSFGYGLSFSEDSSLLAAGVGHQVVLWRAGEWQQPTILRQHREAVTAVAFSPAGTTLASGAGDEVLLGGFQGPDEPLTRVMGHHGFLSGMVFSPDGLSLVTAGFDKRIQVHAISNP